MDVGIVEVLDGYVGRDERISGLLSVSLTYAPMMRRFMISDTNSGLLVARIRSEAIDRQARR